MGPSKPNTESEAFDLVDLSDDEWTDTRTLISHGSETCLLPGDAHVTSTDNGKEDTSCSPKWRDVNEYTLVDMLPQGDVFGPDREQDFDDFVVLDTDYAKDFTCIDNDDFAHIEWLTDAPQAAPQIASAEHETTADRDGAAEDSHDSELDPQHVKEPFRLISPAITSQVADYMKYSTRDHSQWPKLTTLRCIKRGHDEFYGAQTLMQDDYGNRVQRTPVFYGTDTVTTYTNSNRCTTTCVHYGTDKTYTWRDGTTKRQVDEFYGPKVEFRFADGCRSVQAGGFYGRTEKHYDAKGFLLSGGGWNTRRVPW